MIEKDKKFVRSLELPICPFCNGKVYYNNWITHKIFNIKCQKCNSNWRSGINKNDNRDIFLELLSSENHDISNEYINKKLSIDFWRDLLREKIGEKI